MSGLDAAIAAVGRSVAAADVVVPMGGGTHWEVGGRVPDGTAVRAPAGIVEYDPAELTVTVGAGTTVAELDAVLGEAGQQCPLDPRDPAATIGGVLAVGLSGVRRLRFGPVRNCLLEVHVVTGDGRRVKGGGRTVKNVSGYDVARLMVGSLGTLGVVVQVTLRCEPRAARSVWLDCEGAGWDVVARAFRPAAALTDGRRTAVLVEGYPEDVVAEGRRLRAMGETDPPPWPTGPHRGRISVRAGALEALAPELDAIGVAWLAEAGVGTVHVATSDPARLLDARVAAHGLGGWLLREAGAPEVDGFGVPMPNGALMARLKEALDPSGKCNPGRLPIANSRPPAEVERTVGSG